MTAASAPVVTLALCLAGMAALSLAMDRHGEHLTGRGEPSRKVRIAARAIGALLLALALWRCVVAWGPSVGPVAWCGGLTAGALLAAGLLTWRPRWTLGAGLAAGVVGLFV